MIERTCRRCGTTMDIMKYHKCDKCIGGRASTCPNCCREKDKLKRSQYTEEQNKKLVVDRRNRILRYFYGITLADYNRIFTEQNGCCAICGIPASQVANVKNNRMGLHVDHDHVTGKVRELLCHKCNYGLGNADDSEERLMLMISYLRKHKTNPEDGEEEYT